MGNLRISGMATGMDTEKMIKDMMKPYNMRLDKMKQGSQLVQWKQDSYRDIISNISDITKKYFDVLNGDTYALSPKNYSSLKPTVLDSNSGLKVNAGTAAQAGKYSITVDKLAEKAIYTGAVDVDINKTLTGKADFTVNGVNFTYDFDDASKDKGKTISQVLQDVSDKAKVDARYSQLTKKVIISSKNEGAAQNINAADTSGDFFNSLFGTSTISAQGKNSKGTLITPNGTGTFEKSSNNFSIDGVNYDITAVKENSTVTFALEGDSEESFNKIKAFIDDYNKLIDKLQTKNSEKKYRNYAPLTEEQKKEMKESDIKSWEEKAKSGLLRGDSNLQSMVFSLRRAFFDSVESSGIRLQDMGLTTSRNYKDGGKIVFDDRIDKNGNTGEARLKKLLKEDPDKVFKIFSQQSTTYPSYSPDLTLAEKSKRYNEEGILQRINDIFSDYTRTTRNADGRRGTLIEKAGIKGETTEKTNVLFKDLEKRQKAIEEMERKLAERENKYYLQFARLEKYMNAANSQSAWIAKQFGAGAQ